MVSTRSCCYEHNTYIFKALSSGELRGVVLELFIGSRLLLFQLLLFVRFEAAQSNSLSFSKVYISI